MAGLRSLVAALGCVVVLGGCALAPRDETPAAPVLAPATEAIGYLPADAELVALVDSARRGEQWRAAAPALARAGLGPALERVRGDLAAVGLDSVAGAGLLSNRIAIALPRVDSPQGAVAALVVPDADLLGLLVQARVNAGLFRPAGIHRDAQLFTGDGLALATRGTLLLVAPDVAGLRAALDRRNDDSGYSPRDFKAAVDGLPARSLIRAAIDPERALAERDAVVPWLSAIDRAGMSVSVEQERLVIRVRARSTGDELAEADLPLPSHPSGPPIGVASAAPGTTVGLADLPHFLQFAYRAAFAAHPAQVARAEAETVVLRGRRRVDPPRELLAALAGPATLVRRDGRWMLRAPVATGRREAARVALGRLSARLPRVLAALGLDDPRVAPLDGLVAVERGQRVLASFGLVGDTVVVGNAPAGELTAFAAAGEQPVAWAHGPLAVSIDDAALNGMLGDLLAQVGIVAEPRLGRAHLWARTTPRELRLELRVPL